MARVRVPSGRSSPQQAITPIRLRDGFSLILLPHSIHLVTDLISQEADQPPSSFFQLEDRPEAKVIWIDIPVLSKKIHDGQANRRFRCDALDILTGTPFGTSIQSDRWIFLKQGDSFFVTFHQ